MKQYLALFLALVMLLALAACGKTETPETLVPQEEAAAPAVETGESVEEEAAADPDAPKVLRIGSLDAAQSHSPLDPGALSQYLSYEFLTRYSESGEILPWLAESVEWIDELHLKVTLRDDVYFASGNKMTGEDVLYSYELSATTPGSTLGEKLWCIDFEQSYVEDDGLTVMFVLNTPFTILDVWFPKIAITEKALASERPISDGAWWDDPISSSPYEMVENVDGSHTTFVARDDYWDKENQPEWDEITFYYYSNATAMFIAFENGELDMLYKADLGDYERAISGDVANPDTTEAYTVGTDGAMFVVMNSNSPYFQDIKVREAVAHALDYEAIGAVIYGDNQITHFDSSVSPNLDGYISVGEYEYDLEYAKQCMAESEYPDGFDITYVGDVGNNPHAEVMQAQLAEIGINMTIDSYDFPTMIMKFMEPYASDVAFWGGTLSSFDAYDTLSPFHDANGISASRIMDEEWNEIFDECTSIMDKEERNVVYAEMQTWLYENIWAIPMFEPLYSIVYDNSVVDCEMFDISVDCIQFSVHPAS